MKTFKWTLLFIFTVLLFAACNHSSSTVPVVGYVDAFEDETLAQARSGFFKALAEEGYSETDSSLKVIYRNAQGDIPTLTQIVNYMLSERVNLIATNSTIATLTAAQRSKEIPIFMMVSAEPKQMHILDDQGKAQPNLLGVTETLDYIDVSFGLIPQLIKSKGQKLKVGMIYNQSEVQSTDALQRAKAMAEKYGVELISMPINNSADAQMVVQSLLNKNIDAFFANPDNIVFAAFETILKNCNKMRVPIFTSEAGLVARGALAAYGADIFQWGYQSGKQAAQFLKNKNTNGLSIEYVKLRKKLMNKAVAAQFNIQKPEGFEYIE